MSSTETCAPTPEIKTIHYSTKHAPTIRRFRDDDNFVRLIVGPFGSGKSSGCLMDIIKRASKQCPDDRGIRRVRWAVVRNCYDDQTEILTEQRGWVLFRDLLPTDRVAMLKDGHTVFTTPSYYYSKEYDGEMIGFENEGLNFLVTPDHKLSVSLRNARKKEWSSYRLRKASECFGKTNMRVRRSAKWRGIAPAGLSVELFEWLGYWFAEGSTYSGNGRNACHITTKNDIEYAKSLFYKAGLPFKENKRSDHGVNLRLPVAESTISLIRKLASCGRSKTKAIPPEWKNAPVSHLRAFIAGYLAGDGSHRTKDKTICAVTSSRNLANDLQEIGLRAGYVVNINDTATCKSEMVINNVRTRQNVAPIVVTFLTESKYSPALNSSGRYRGWYKQQYSGKVYCVEVPTHIIYVRRKDRAFWCSQTYRELLDTTVNTVLDWLPEIHFGKFYKTEMVYWITGIEGYEIELMFRALDSEEDIKKLLSLEITGAWLNEFRQIPKPIFDAIQGRVGRFPPTKDEGCSWFGVIGDSNPYEDDSEYCKFLEGPDKPANISLYRQPSGLSAEAENIPFLPKNYYQNLATGKDAEFIKVFVEGKNGYIQDGDPITPEYSEAIHRSLMDLQPLAGVRGIRFWDAGHNPTCIVAQINPSSGRLQVYDTIVGVNCGMKQLIAVEVKPLMNTKYSKISEWLDTGDPAVSTRDQSDTEMSPARMIETELDTTYTPGVTDWDTRKEAIKYVFGNMPMLLLSKGEEKLHKAFRGGWQYVKVTDGTRVSNVPMKNIHSHPADAISQGLPRVISLPKNASSDEDWRKNAAKTSWRSA